MFRAMLEILSRVNYDYQTKCNRGHTAGPGNGHHYTCPVCSWTTTSYARSPGTIRLNTLCQRLRDGDVSTADFLRAVSHTIRLC